MRAILAASVVLVLAAAPAAAQTPAPAFASRVEAVRVDVLVTDGGRAVRGLQAHDFEVFDNGVRQEVELVTFERQPLNVVLAFDVSDSLVGERLQHLRAAGLAVLDQLTGDDAAALLTFSHAVVLGTPLTSDRTLVRAALARAEASGRTALIDAAFAGMLLAEAEVGRSLLIVFSDGLDTASWLGPAAVLDTARRSDVVVYCVSASDAGGDSFVSELTSLTGGGLLRVSSTRDVGAAFIRILEEFRQRYLVSYTPRGVAGAGWHRLDVRVKGRRATVRARPGYLAGR